MGRTKMRAETQFEQKIYEERVPESRDRFSQEDFTPEERMFAEAILSSHTDPLHIPKHIIPAGVRYKWIRRSFSGRSDEGYFGQEKRKGWIPVPAERHPEYVTDINSGIIENQGLVLCERLLKLCEIEDRTIQQATDRSLNTQIGLDQLPVEAKLPGLNPSNKGSETKFEHGRPRW